MYLGATTYGIICDIRTPHPQQQPNQTPLKTPGHSSKGANKVTCRSGSRGRKTDVKGSIDSGRGKRGKTSQTLSESRKEQYGITATTVKPRSIRSNTQQIDYVSLNDGYEEDTLSPTKKGARSHTGPKVLPQQDGYLRISV